MIKNLLLCCISFLFPVTLPAQWTQLVSGTNKVLNEIYFPVSDTGFVAGNEGTLLRTQDGGTTWTALTIGTNHNLNDVYFRNSQAGYVVGDSGLFALTTDGGNSWTISYLTNTGDINLNSVYFTSSHDGYAGGSENFTQGIIFKTTDGGLTWTVCPTPVSALDVDYKRLVFPKPDIGYALSRGMCIKTIDAGLSWTITDTALVNSGGMFSILEDAFFFSPDTGYIVGWYNPFAGYTENGGTTWTDQLVLNNQWYSIDFPSQQIGYMVGWSQLAKTVDGGHTWTDITSSLIMPGGLYSMDFTDDNTGYACGDNGRILKTTNGGTTAIADIDSKNYFQLYPNPTNGSVTVTVDATVFSQARNVQFEVRDICGKVITQEEIHTATQKIELQVAKGIYVVNINSGGVSHFEKIVVE